MIRAVQLYTFLQYCNESDLPKEILECGVGSHPSLEPLLLRFHAHGYATHGIEISHERLANAERFFREQGIDTDLRLADMREIPYADESMSFCFSYNSIFHMRKRDVAVSMREIWRVLRPGGLCFVNFLSVDSSSYGQGTEEGPGEFLGEEGGRETFHSYFQDGEPDTYFDGFSIFYKEKRVREILDADERFFRGYIDIIAKKQPGDQ
jgi:ubiquinone/menaquinone biosynthesis C-methylase UbiE